MPARIPLPRQLHSRPFSVEAGRQRGLSDERMRGPDLQSPFHGVRSPLGTASLRDLCIAYSQRMPATAFICGVTAARLMGVPLPLRLESSRVLHVAVPSPARAPRGRGIRGSSVSVRSGDIREWHSLRISSPTRVWCELASELSVADLVAAGDFLIQWRLPSTTRDALASAVHEFAGRRGLANMRAALPLLDERAESRRESIVRVALSAGGITGIAANHWVTTSAGYRHRIDLAIPGCKLAIEYQGEHHIDPKQFRDDLTRRSRLEADGWCVMFIGAGDLDNIAELLQRIRLVLSTRPIFD